VGISKLKPGGNYGWEGNSSNPRMELKGVEKEIHRAKDACEKRNEKSGKLSAPG